MLTMKKGEVALVTVPPEYAFSSAESKQDLSVVPAHSIVYYEVEMVSFVKVWIFYNSLFYLVDLKFIA